jgi:hypothetical protein
MQQGQSCGDLQFLPYSHNAGEEGRKRRIDVAVTSFLPCYSDRRPQHNLHPKPPAMG